MTATAQLINVNAGNLNSIKNAFSLIGVSVREVCSPNQLNETDPIILPGVGAFGAIVERLRKSGLFSRLLEVPAKQQPLLGICLGMQLLAESSEESPGVGGLGIIAGEVRSLPIVKDGSRVPNVGWRILNATDQAKPSLNSVLENKSYYHMHTYFFEPANSEVIDATFRFNNASIPVAISAGSVTAVQFHPEKSQEDGLNFLKNWADSTGAFL